MLGVTIRLLLVSTIEITLKTNQKNLLDFIFGSKLNSLLANDTKIRFMAAQSPDPIQPNRACSCKDQVLSVRYSYNRWRPRHGRACCLSVISFSRVNKADYRELPPNSFSFSTYCSNALPVTPWTSRVAERLQGVVADAEVELLPSVSANALKFSFLL